MNCLKTQCFFEAINENNAELVLSILSKHPKLINKRIESNFKG